MSDSSPTPFEQFWTSVSGVQPQAYQQAFGAFEQHLAAFSQAAGQLQADAQTATLPASFHTLTRSALTPPDVDTNASCVRLTRLAAELQQRLMQTSSTATAESQACNAVDPPGSLQEAFDRWVVSYERHLLALLTERAFGATFGEAVNAALHCLRDTQQTVPQSQAVEQLQRDVDALSSRVDVLVGRSQ